MFFMGRTRPSCEHVRNARWLLQRAANKKSSRSLTARLEWVFTSRPDSTTFVSITNTGFGGDDDEVLKQALNSAEGVTLVLAGIKALLEHHIILNLLMDRFPDAVKRGKKLTFQKEVSSMDKPHHVMPDVEVLSTHFPIPGMGFLPVNAFIIKAKEPVLIDAGLGIDSDDFMKAIESAIDPEDLKWVWITHDDADHMGSVRKVLEAAPAARLAVNALGMLRMSTAWKVPMDRVHWLNPGDSINVGDRRLTAVRPPLFDNPTTNGIYDEKSQAFFSADCFGAIIPSPAQDAEEVREADLSRGMITWACADSPWVHMVEPGKFKQGLNRIGQMPMKMILSGHLPPARNKMEQFLKLLVAIPKSEPFVAPNQTVLEQMLTQMKDKG